MLSGPFQFMDFPAEGAHGSRQIHKALRRNLRRKPELSANALKSRLNLCKLCQFIYILQVIFAILSQESKKIPHLYKSAFQGAAGCFLSMSQPKSPVPVGIRLLPKENVNLIELYS